MKLYLNKWDLFHEDSKLKTLTPVLSVLLGAFFISFSGVYVKLANVTPTVSAFYRMFFGGIMLLIIVLVLKKKRWHSLSYFGLTVFAGLVMALDLVIWHMGIHYIGPGLATILGNFQVFIMAFFGYVVFKEKIGLRFLFAIGLAVVGLFLMTGAEWNIAGPQYKLGVYLGLATAVCYATYLLILRIVQLLSNPLSAVTNLTVITIVTATTLFFTAILKGESLVIPDGPSLFYLLCYGLVSQVIGWGIIVLSLPRIKASLGGFILLLQPALSFVWDVIIFDRPLNWFISIGICITLTAIYLGTTGQSVKSK